MAEDDGGEGGEGKLPRVDHGPLNEGAVGKNIPFLTKVDNGVLNIQCISRTRNQTPLSAQFSGVQFAMCFVCLLVIWEYVDESG